MTPVVDVCTGLSVERSGVTDVIGDVNGPIVTAVEGTLNGLLGIVDPLNLIPDLSIDLTTILGNAAAGDPIAVDVRDTDGNLVGPGDCNLTVDGVALNTEAGIAIGGNAITGLGASGQGASAGELDAIAIGNNASTASGATGAVAFGTGASATALNSVALGAGSIADRGPILGYTAPGLAGTSDSAGSVSVGAADSLRQITNVAPGTAASDVATVGQLQGALDGVAALEIRVTNAEGDIAGLDARVTVVEGDIAALDTRVTTVEGDITALDARVTVNEGDIAILQADVLALDARVTLNGTAIGDLQTDLAAVDGRVTVTETQIANLDTSVTNIDARVSASETNITTLQQQVANVPVRYVDDTDRTTPSATPTNTVALASASGGPAVLTNVAAGTLSATSTEAVNGAQLYATNQQVAANTAAILVLGSSGGGTMGPVQYSDPGSPTLANGGTVTNDATLVGANAFAPVRLHNVADGTLANDAVNLSQLQSGLNTALSDARAYTDTRIAALEFNIADVGADLGRLRRDAFAGSAAAMAFGAIPQPLEVGKSMFGTSVAHFRGQTAFAVGGSTVVDEGRGVIKFGGAIDSRGHGGVTAGVGIGF